MKKMTEIRSEVITKLDAMLLDENVSLEEVDIVKFNDMFQYGIAFKTGDVGKTLYVNDFISEGKSADDIADEMMAAFESSVDVPPWEMVRNMQTRQSLASLSDNLFVALLEVERNEKYLQDMPYQELGNGLAYICQIRYEDPSGNGFMSAAVKNNLVKSNGWDIEEIFRIAIGNTLENNAPKLYNMGDALFGNPENILDNGICDTNNLLVLTNDTGIFGAASLFLPGIIDKIHDCLGCGFFGIPSSTHEFIIVPESIDIRIEDLSIMCKEANATIVDQKDILSDHVLHIPLK